jgi:hypothetical protein
LPVQGWASLQQLTAAELTSVTNMLPYPSTTSGSVNPCVAGTFYLSTATTAATFKLPTPSIGTVIGLYYLGTGGSATLLSHALEAIYSPYIPGAVGALGFNMPAFGQYMVVQSDGVNWFEIASGGLSGKGMLAYVETTGGPAISSTTTPGVQITGATATVAVVAGRVVRIRWTGYLSSPTTVNCILAITKGGSAIGQTVRIGYIVAGQNVNMITEYIDTPATGSVTYACNAWTSGTITPQLGIFTVEDVT